MTNAQILLDSRNAITGDRAVSFLLPRFPYALIQEPATHRILHGEHLTEPWSPFPVELSRNSASMRAIPIKTVIERIKADPYIPTWTAANKGMVGLDNLSQETKDKATDFWLTKLDFSIQEAEFYLGLGIAKQDANRALQRFMRIPIIVTGTEWDNFFNLRTAPDVQPDFRETALEMKALYDESEPHILRLGEWHIPFGDRISDGLNLLDTLRISSARCARISYATHDGIIDHKRDLKMCDDLISSVHLSPLGHQLQATVGDRANYKGFTSFRYRVENICEVFINAK